MVGVESHYFLNVRVDTLSLSVALEQIENLLRESKTDGVPRHVFFANVHSIYLARKDQEFRRYLENADLVLPDGSGLNIAGKVLDMPIQANLNGTDFVPKVCRMAATGGWSIYLLGAEPGVVDECQSNLKKKYPNIRIAGYHHGYFPKEEELEIINEINELKPDILLVAMGSPLQEKWIARYTHLFDANLCFAVGGLFDFLSEDKVRAPLWMRKLGIEWLFRFLQDPFAKWNRIFIEIPEFLFQVLKSKSVYELNRLYFRKLRWLFNDRRNS